MAGWVFSLRKSVALGCSAVLASFVLCAFGQTFPPLLLRNPSLSGDKIAFLYADDVWTVSRQGGEARRLTSVNAVMEGPYFSPDGTRIAYSTREHGLTDVYVVSAEGGVPQRLTWEPTGNFAVGWTPDGKDVLFGSGHASYSDFPGCFAPMPMAPDRPRFYPYRAQRRVPSRRTEIRWPTCLWRNGKARGSTTGAARPRRCGW